MSIVRILKDEQNEMLMIEVDGKLLFEGNYWDFNIHDTLQDVLEAAGVTYEEGDYDSH